MIRGMALVVRLPIVAFVLLACTSEFDLPDAQTYGDDSTLPCWDQPSPAQVTFRVHNVGPGPLFFDHNFPVTTTVRTVEGEGLFTHIDCAYCTCSGAAAHGCAVCGYRPAFPAVVAAGTFHEVPWDGRTWWEGPVECDPSCVTARAARLVEYEVTAGLSPRFAQRNNVDGVFPEGFVSETRRFTLGEDDVVDLELGQDLPVLDGTVTVDLGDGEPWESDFASAHTLDIGDNGVARITISGIEAALPLDGAARFATVFAPAALGSFNVGGEVQVFLSDEYLSSTPFNEGRVEVSEYDSTLIAGNFAVIDSVTDLEYTGTFRVPIYSP